MDIVNSAAAAAPKNMPLKKDDISTMTTTELNSKYIDLAKTYNKVQRQIDRETDRDAIIDHMRYEKRLIDEMNDIASELKRRVIGKGFKKMIIGSGYAESPVEVRKRKNAVMK